MSPRLQLKGILGDESTTLGKVMISFETGLLAARGQERHGHAIVEAV
jgi:hypothetical protein